jgi:hypothetical protein
MDKLLLILTSESERCFQFERNNVIQVHVQESILKGINFQSKWDPRKISSVYFLIRPCTVIVYDKKQ